MITLLLACSEYDLTKGAHHGGPEGSGDTASWVDDGGTGPGTPWQWGEDDVPDGGREVTDEYVVQGNDRVDFVFFGDTSSSMQEELVTLGSKMEEFVGILSASGEDWRLAAITGPSGCAVGGVFSESTPGVAAAFAAAILTPPGADLVDEWGLYNVATAVENTDAGECNEGLVRGGASVQAIFLSDENDDSPGSADGDPDYWRTYVDAIWAKVGDASDVRLSAIAGPVPDGCAGADPGYGYSEATDATGGEFISLCTDWASQVSLLATDAVTQSRFTLTETPEVETIEVHVDGQPVDGDWSYLPDGNFIAFTRNPPAAMQVVEVHYLVQG